MNFFPQLKDKLVYKSLGTALTNKNYLGRYEFMGRKLDMKYYLSNEFMNINTPIKGLYLSGTDISNAGIEVNLLVGIVTSFMLEKII